MEEGEAGELEKFRKVLQRAGRWAAGLTDRTALLVDIRVVYTVPETDGRRLIGVGLAEFHMYLKDREERKKEMRRLRGKCFIPSVLGEQRLASCT